MLFFKQFGVGLAVAILIDATIVRGVLLPASMKLLGNWNWYLPSWLEWLPRLDHGDSGPSCRRAADSRLGVIQKRIAGEPRPAGFRARRSLDVRTFEKLPAPFRVRAVSTDDDLQTIRDALHSIRLSDDEQEQLSRERRRWELDNYERIAAEQLADREAQRRRQTFYVVG